PSETLFARSLVRMATGPSPRLYTGESIVRYSASEMGVSMRCCPNPACPDGVRASRAAEYVDSVRVCPTCDTRLVEARLTYSPEGDESATGALMSDIEMVCVLRTASEGLAALVKSLLDGENIRYVVKGEALQDLLGWGRIVGAFNYVV